MCWCDTPDGMQFHEAGSPHTDRDTGEPLEVKTYYCQACDFTYTWEHDHDGA